MSVRTNIYIIQSKIKWEIIFKFIIKSFKPSVFSLWSMRNIANLRTAEPNLCSAYYSYSLNDTVCHYYTPFRVIKIDYYIITKSLIKLFDR